MDEYKTIYRAKARTKHRYFEIARAKDPKCAVPWVVRYCGAGYYFLSLYGCLCYCYGRGFIDKREIESIGASINGRLKGGLGS